MTLHIQIAKCFFIKLDTGKENALIRKIVLYNRQQTGEAALMC